MSAAIKQQHVQILFQLLYRVGQTGWRLAHRLRYRRKGAAALYLIQQQQSIKAN